MKTWQAASAGLVLGVAATMGIGAIGRTEVGAGPFFQVTRQEIVNTSHIQTASIAPMAGPNSNNGEWAIDLTFENGKEERLTYSTGDEAREVWRKLQGVMWVEQVAPPAVK